MSRKKKKEQKKAHAQLINTRAITDYSLQTYGHMSWYILSSANISVLSESYLGADLRLDDVLKGMADRCAA